MLPLELELLDGTQVAAVHEVHLLALGLVEGVDYVHETTLQGRKYFSLTRGGDDA